MLWGCGSNSFLFVGCDYGCRGCCGEKKWGLCSCSLSYDSSNCRWKHVFDTLSKQHNSLGNSRMVPHRGGGREGKSNINDKCVMWSWALPCSLSIFYPSFLRTHISPFIVFLHLSRLLHSCVLPEFYFPVAHSSLLGHFVWYTNVSLSFYLSVYLPLLPLFCASQSSL